MAWLSTLYSIALFFQPDATGPVPGPSGGGDASPPAGCGGPEQLGMILFMVLIFYFMLIRPQQKRQKETDAMLKGLGRGAVVRTTGGIRGEITDLGDRDVTLMVADKVRINVLRTHVAGVEPDPSTSSNDGATKKDA